MNTSQKYAEMQKDGTVEWSNFVVDYAEKHGFSKILTNCIATIKGTVDMFPEENRELVLKETLKMLLLKVSMVEDTCVACNTKFIIPENMKGLANLCLTCLEKGGK